MKPLPQDDLQNRVISCLLSLDRVLLQHTFEGSGIGMVPFAEEIMVPALKNIGDRWQNGELSLAQVYMGSRICEQLLDSAPVEPKSLSGQHNIAIAVLEDFHVLGKRLVLSVVRAAGYAVRDYGQMHVEELCNSAMADNIRILMVSTLMLDSALRIRVLKDRFNEAGYDIKLVAGGAPFRFDTNLWQEVGADACSATASGAVEILNTLTREVNHGNA